MEGFEELHKTLRPQLVHICQNPEKEMVSITPGQVTELSVPISQLRKHVPEISGFPLW